mgnify:CR=1 FL=1
MDALENEILELKNGKVHNDFCVNDALQHLEKVKEALRARESNAKEYYKENIEHAKWVMKVMPVLYLLDGFPLPPQGSGGN